MRIGSSTTLLICVSLLFVGYIFNAYVPAAPYGTMAPAIVALASAYFTKRVVEKSEKYGGTPWDNKKWIPPVYLDSQGTQTKTVTTTNNTKPCIGD
jgi:uncharacterized membrane protein YbhN (UPF0104 family)